MKNKLTFHAFLCIILVLGFEILMSGNISRFIAWFEKNPFDLLLPISVLICSIIILEKLHRKLFFLPLVVYSIVAIFGYGKMRYTAQPLLITDLKLASEILVLKEQFITPKYITILVFSFLLIGAISYLLIKYNSKLKDSDSTAKVSSILISLLVIFANIGVNNTSFLGQFLIVNSYNFMSLNSNDLESSDIGEGLGGYDFSGQVKQELGFKPNIIILQSEAFWEVDKLGLNLSEDPIPFYRTLKNNSTIGELFVPVFGGGTCNTEFEIITGTSLKTYPHDWHLVYPSDIKSPYRSLATILEDEGYDTFAFHPFHSWYFNRIEVYKHLGFDEFKSMEHLDNPDMLDVYVKDSHVTKEILEKIESSEKPILHFAISVQNHAPYGNNRFEIDEVKIDVYQNRISDSSKFLLSNYVNGLYLSDKDLQDLIAGIKATGEPTILLFYGDHLPAIGEDYQIYRETSFIPPNVDAKSLSDIDLVKSVPFLLWKSYDESFNDLGKLNASFMTPRLMYEAGLEMDEQMQMMYKVSQKFPLFFRNGLKDKNGVVYQTSSKEYQFVLNQLNLQKENMLSKGRDSENYNESLSKIKIDSVKGLDIMGENFYKNGILTVNDEVVEFEFIDKQNIQVKSKSHMLQSGSTLKMVLTDSNGAVLAESSEFIIP